MADPQIQEAPPMVLVALLLAVAGWSLAPDDGEPAPVVRDGGILEQFPAGECATVGPIAGRTIDGGRFVDNADVEGHVLVYNVWGSWCSPWRKEAPDLKRLSDELHSKGVRFVGIDVKGQRRLRGRLPARVRHQVPQHRYVGIWAGPARTQ